MKTKQKWIMLWMVNREALIRKIEELINSGHEIVSINNLRDFHYPNMDSVAVTDWLILYK